MAYETSIICDKCSERYSEAGISTKSWLKRRARELGWTIGKKDHCPKCRQKRRKPLYDYRVTTSFPRGWGRKAREIIKAENEEKALGLAAEYAAERYGDDFINNKNRQIHIRVDRLTKDMM